MIEWTYYDNKINKDKIIDYISLSYDLRFVRRKKLVSDNGIEFLVNLSETKSLIHNQAFKLEDEKLIVIVSNKEELILRPFFSNIFISSIFTLFHNIIILSFILLLLSHSFNFPLLILPPNLCLLFFPLSLNLFLLQ